MSDNVQDLILYTIEASLEAQLRAVRRLRKGLSPEEEPKKRSRSQLSIVHDILSREGTPMHVTDIIQCAKTDFDCVLDRESIVSSLSKKVAKQDTFMRTDKNTFALAEDDGE